MNNPAIESNVYMHHQKQMQVEEFPERPGEPECSYFLKTGDLLENERRGRGENIKHKERKQSLTFKKLMWAYKSQSLNSI